MEAGANPAQIQAPGLLKADGHDLPIAQERPAIHKPLQAVLDAPALGPGHDLVKERVDQTDRFCPMYTTDLPNKSSYAPFTTYLGATMMALCNVSPFLNFLDEAEQKKAFSDPVLDVLASLARSFRGWNPNEEADIAQQNAVISRLGILRELIETPKPGQIGPFNDGGCHVIGFINCLFTRIEHAQLSQDLADDGNNASLPTRFKQLFKYFIVRHTPMRCRCGRPVLRRQDTQDAQPSGYYLRAEISKAMKLDQAISRAMWETTEIGRTCPVCGDKVKAHDFDKFAYLPEVFCIFPHFIDKSGGPGNYKYLTDEKLTYPEWVDMSAFRDDPARPGDETDCTYKLQSIITSSDPIADGGTSYKTALRVNKNEFAQFDFNGTVTDSPHFVTFETINEASDNELEVPHLLIYVRERHAQAPNAVKSQSYPPQGNPPRDMIAKTTRPQDATKKAVSPIPTQPRPRENQPVSFNLQRFVAAQNQRGQTETVTPFERAESELRRGRKTGHWMWYMFPQVAGLSQSDRGQVYSIKSLAEARAYWNDPALKSRYLQLVDIVLNGSQTDLNVLFGADAEKFQASLTLFLYVCISNFEQSDYLQNVFQKFHMGLHTQTFNVFVPWLKSVGEEDAIYEVAVISGLDPAGLGGGGNGKQETRGHGPGISYTVTSTGTGSTTHTNHNKDGVKTKEPTMTRQPATTDSVGHGNSRVINATNGSAQRIGSALLSLADQELDDDDAQYQPEVVSAMNDRARNLGRAILGFGVPQDIPTPVATPETEERSRRLGRHLMSLSLSDDGPSYAGSYEPGDGYNPGYDSSLENAPGNLSLGNTGGGLGLDGSSDGPDDGVDPDEEELFQAIAIPTDPEDPRIKACKDWPLEDLKVEFQKEQLDWRGLKSDKEKHRGKFLKHFEFERDYSIYHEGRLRQAIRDRGIPLRHDVDKADKAELVDALTNYDAQRLQGVEYVEGDESDESESIRYDSEPYESSEASGNEAWYVERERAVLSASRKEGATPGRATARPQKRPRDEDEDYEEDEDEEGQEITPRAPPKPVRMRARYH